MSTGRVTSISSCRATPSGNKSRATALWCYQLTMVVLPPAHAAVLGASLSNQLPQPARQHDEG